MPAATGLWECSLVARKVAPAVEHESPRYQALYYRYFRGFLGPDGARPDAAEFSQIADEIAYVFPSDSGLTCVAVSVNLETFRWLRQDFEARYAERIAEHRGLAPRVAGVHATFLADAIVDRLGGSADERSAFSTYHERRNAHGLGAYHETVHYAADLRRLEA